jgi:hypothetical protein
MPEYTIANLQLLSSAAVAGARRGGTGRHLGDKIEAYALLYGAEVLADGSAGGSAPYHRKSVGGRGHILVPQMPYFETPSRLPEKAPFVGFLASKHGQSLPARASLQRPI